MGRTEFKIHRLKIMYSLTSTLWHKTMPLATLVKKLQMFHQV